MLICLLESINVKTAEPIKPNSFEATRMTPGMVYGWYSKLQIFRPQKMATFIIFENSPI